MVAAGFDVLAQFDVKEPAECIFAKGSDGGGPSATELLPSNDD
jgi:hypothetical protein